MTLVEKRLVRDAGGSLELRLTCPAAEATVVSRIPVEAEGFDSDGCCIHFLLRVVDGRVAELEIYKDDGTRMKRFPRPEDLTVTVFGT